MAEEMLQASSVVQLRGASGMVQDHASVTHSPDLSGFSSPDAVEGMRGA